ncbi:MAG: hypothetical protein MUO31_03420 [Thermodesulfovibrionales bacterium]|nr:hypothetical protein [Thermodesulfovibrionales bacterium]
MPTKVEFNPRKLMELTIEVMRQTVHEPRKDSKVNPLVGAVLWKPNGEVETAHRCELRSGDHAEFTLLERKNRSNKLDGSILFTTMEPCAPGSRHEPKLSCAERIVLARIKEVWVGIGDPDPTVDRKGIKFLQDAGVKVDMFDRDLQEVIQKENKEFISQALDRAAEEKKKKPKVIMLSPFDDVLIHTVIKDFSIEALEYYRVKAKIEDAVNSSAFNLGLLKQGLLKEEKGQIRPTGFGFLLFGKKLRQVIHQAGVLATINYPNGKKELKDFDMPLVLIPDQVEKWLDDKLPNVIDRSRMQRKELHALPFEMVREAIVNALIHRDYSIAGAKCQLEITEDTITIKSPGPPIPPITLQQLQSFCASMLSRNPSLHYVFACMEIAEERGIGIRSLRAGAEKLDLPLPKYTFEDPYLVLTLYRNQEGIIQELHKDIFNQLNVDEKTALRFISTKDSLTSSDLIKKMEIDERKAQRILMKLVKLKLLLRVSKGPATRYKVVRQ